MIVKDRGSIEPELFSQRLEVLEALCYLKDQWVSEGILESLSQTQKDSLKTEKALEYFIEDELGQWLSYLRIEYRENDLLLCEWLVHPYTDPDLVWTAFYHQVPLQGNALELTLPEGHSLEVFLEKSGFIKQREWTLLAFYAPRKIVRPLSASWELHDEGGSYVLRIEGVPCLSQPYQNVGFWHEFEIDKGHTSTPQEIQVLLNRAIFLTRQQGFQDALLCRLDDPSKESWYHLSGFTRVSRYGVWFCP